ncbi:unnamed protein product [Cyclocybe aegerita]|uniref:Clavaminate synthase-like protein n=1 Tax=Cyclocybe aegerita TaxID=1973307 RepID=A0A8S0VZF2_CYCAE|nr:unnamed protein product [Cyclocybe aegerita]
MSVDQEQWKPVIEQLFDLRNTKDRTRRVREAWAIDWQNRGESAVLNREALNNRPDGVCIYEWTPVVADFVRSPRMQGHCIVPIGQSAGSAAIMLTTKEIPPCELAYPAMFLIEPTTITHELFSGHLEDRIASMNFAVAAIAARRNTWKSREAAFEYSTKRFPWGMWDERVVRARVEHGRESVPNGDVILKCDRKQEAVSYPDTEAHFESAVQLGRICHAVRVHIVWGTRNDLVSPTSFRPQIPNVNPSRHSIPTSIPGSIRYLKDRNDNEQQELWHSLCRSALWKPSVAFGSFFSSDYHHLLMGGTTYDDGILLLAGQHPTTTYLFLLLHLYGVLASCMRSDDWVIRDRYKAAGVSAVDPSVEPDCNTVEFLNVAKDDALAWPKEARRAYPRTANTHMESIIGPFVCNSLEINNLLLEIFNEKLNLWLGTLMERRKMEELSGSETRVIRNPSTTNTNQAIGSHTDFGSLSFLHNRLGGLQVLVPGSDSWQYVKLEAYPGPRHLQRRGRAGHLQGRNSSLEPPPPPSGSQAGLERWSLVYFKS